ncbi:hypothetical protein D3C72_1936820 [compost metagenome]
MLVLIGLLLGSFGRLLFFVFLGHWREAFGDTLFIGLDLLLVAEAEFNRRTCKVVGIT